MPASRALKLIVGLGNPGAQYEGTRHNAGRELVEAIAVEQGLKFSKKSSLRASVAEFKWQEKETVLAFPQTYMNLSGEAVRALADHFKVNPALDLLVVVDDVALPFGKLRLRMHGSDGGHKGLRSVAQALGTQDFARLRIGIGVQDGAGGPHGEPLENFVLEPFEERERSALPEVFKRSREACLLWRSGDPDKAMSTVNHD